LQEVRGQLRVPVHLALPWCTVLQSMSQWWHSGVPVVPVHLVLPWCYSGVTVNATVVLQ
jgi:hypothetical protein